MHYDGPNDFSLWVTRSGLVTVENPLRPLTPVVTRVLQLVIANRVASAYGQDLSGVRRGGSPAALEATLGGPIAWDGKMAALPDPLVILNDSGQLLIELAFKECGTAPAVKATPVAKAKPDKAKTAKAAKKPPAAALAPALPPPSNTAAPGPRPFTIPQGAIQ